MAKKVYESKKAWDLQYQKTRCKMFSLKLAYGTDEDMITFLMGLDNVQGYLRQLIRDDMENSK